jgi:multiple sugar transport system permease protein
MWRCGFVICFLYYLALFAAHALVVRAGWTRKWTGIVALRTVYFLPSVCSGVALLILWKYLYNSDIGFVNTFLRGIGIANPPDWLGTTFWAKPALMLMGLWGGLGGYNMILYLAALQGVPSSYYEAAEIDGAGPWAKFWSITWPMISPTTFFILIMSIIGGFQSGFMTANVMTGGGPAGSTTTIEYYLYQTAFEKFNMGYASAVAWFLFAVILVLTLAAWKLGGRVVTYE